MEYLPPTVDELIALLDKEIPPRCIGVRQDLADAQRYAGKRELVDHLLGLQEDTRTASLGAPLP